MRTPPSLIVVACALANSLVGSAADSELSLLSGTPCRLTTPGAAAAFAPCGRLSVPENPDAPDGAKIDIFVTRIGALTADPRPDPLLIITGGPGQSTVDFYLQSRGAFESIRRDREIVLVDQRGTGRSADGFTCTAPDDVEAEESPEALRRAVTECLASLDHDPRYYTTSVAVRDLEQVRVALGIQQWNVYGISYGTRVAQHYLRRFPANVRAVILDGVVPPPLALGPDVAREAQRALEQIFARCAADSKCGTAFAQLPQNFNALLGRLDGVADQRRDDSAPLRAAELRAAVRLMSYSAATVALLPVMLTEAYESNYGPLANQAHSLLRDLPESLSFPMSNSVTCTEDVPFVEPGANVGLERTYLGTAIIDALDRICSEWPSGFIDESFKAPLVSDRPVLLLSGEYDPITPPSYAERVVTDGLSVSAHLIAPQQGHGVIGVGCIPKVVRDFLERADPEAIDWSCLVGEPPTPFFLSLLGPAP